MTQTELNASLDRQLKRIHDNAHRVWKARKRILATSGIRNRPGDAPESGLSSLGIAALVLMLLLIDAAVAAPALFDRFSSFGLPEGLAWIVSLGCSILLMFAEMVVAVSWFHAYERSLTSRRYFAVGGWTLVALLIMSGPVLLGISQLLVVTGGTVEDLPRMTKEVGLLLLFGGAHILLISSGRYLEAAKLRSLQWVKQTLASIDRYFARHAEESAHNRLSDEYRVHARTVKRAVSGGLTAELGPFEDQALVLIRERHEGVDEAIGNQDARIAGPQTMDQVRSA